MPDQARILCERQWFTEIAADEIIQHSGKLMLVADGPMLQPFARRKSWW